MTRIFILLLLLSLPLVAHGQEQANANQCTTALNREISTEHRLFRAILFGHRSAAEAPVGYITHQTDGSSWYKVSANAWRSTSGGFGNTTHSNALVDRRSEITAALGEPDRRGIFETKGSTTSELIPHIGTSLRAFQCRLHQFCDAVTRSKNLNEDEAQPITATSPGCLPIERESIQACHINERRPISDSVIIFHNCEEAVNSLLRQEAEVVNLAVQYDAAYRSLSQLAGSIDLFLHEFHLPLTGTLRDATDLIGVLGRVPCYVSSCEAFPPNSP